MYTTKSQILEILKSTIDTLPIKKDFYNIDQLRSLGVQLARYHEIAVRNTSPPLLFQITQNQKKIESAFNILNKIEDDKQTAILPAGQWILDNFYVITEHINNINQDLKKEFLNQLHQLTNGSFPGIPRIYEILIHLLSHTDSKLDRINIKTIIEGYQEIIPLSMAELWALPLMIIFSLIEIIKRVATEVVASITEYNKARRLIKELKNIATKDPQKIINYLAQISTDESILSSGFVFELSRQLKNVELEFVDQWLVFFLNNQNTIVEELVDEETQKQSELRISISNCMSSLKLINNLDWQELIEELSLVNKILISDPDNIFEFMDFKSRDKYRDKIEEISKRFQLSEPEIAQTAVSLSSTALKKYGIDDRRSHVGYYLIDDGIKKLKEVLKIKPKFDEKIKKITINNSFNIYLLVCIFFTSVCVFILNLFLSNFIEEIWQKIIILVPAFICLFEKSSEIVKNIASKYVKPKLIPKMEFKEGIPKKASTLVIKTMLLLNKEQIKEQILHLESIYISNIDNNIYFGLLTDLIDSDEELSDEDEELINYTISKIQSLNRKYSNDRSNIFYLFHRKRTYNQIENNWLGWERKRGIILELTNALMDQKLFDHFYHVEGELKSLVKIKYVITLDMDTFLPLNSAIKLVGAMEHPLNRPIFDEEMGCVSKGYGIMQPAVLFDFKNAFKSKYIQIFSSDYGIDPYSQLTLNINQDLFGSGSFIGKGIFNVEIFNKSTKNRFSENQILSHDLIEGCFARSGFVGDIKIYEDAPSEYLTDAVRHHRWIRGDWQILPWIKNKIKVPGNRKVKNPLDFFHKWKIMSNVRSSLYPITFLFFNLLGLIFIDRIYVWAITSILIYFSPNIVLTIHLISHNPKKNKLKDHWNHIQPKIAQDWIYSFIKFTLVPYEAILYLDAIIRTLYRMLISHRKMLEWTTFHQSRQNNKKGLFYYYERMKYSPLVSVLIMAYILVFKSQIDYLIMLILLLWCLSPLIMKFLSKTIPMRESKLPQKDLQFLRKISCRTWSYFEEFVNRDTNWLPPDNFQETPYPILAKRTSPTNIGLYLLSILTSYHFGYISLNEMLIKLNNSFNTLSTLKRYRGHFYNWYGLDDLKPLPPYYISTVDSGNFVGFILTLRQGLMKINDKRIDPERIINGLKDNFEMLLENFQSSQSKHSQFGKNTNQEFEKNNEIFKIKELFNTRSISYLDLSKIINQIESLFSSFKESVGNRLDNNSKLLISKFTTNIIEIKEEINNVISWLKPFTEILEFFHEIQLEPKESDDLLLKFIQISEVFDNFSDLIDNNLTFDNILENKYDLIASAEGFLLLYNHLDFKSKNSTIEDNIDLFIKYYTISVENINEINKKIEKMINEIDQFSKMDYNFLIKRDSNLFSIGFRTDISMLDDGIYDLLASEARLASFIGVSLGYLDIKHWFSLSRQLTLIGKETALISWGGTMFEYLMPLIIMPNFKNSLLDQTYKTIVKAQIDYGDNKDVPWGVSESGYNLTDAYSNYQYQSFGVPGLGAKRGLEQDLVITPYATGLALLISPEKATKNLKKLYNDGVYGKFGYYEAIDFTPSRMPPNQNKQILHSYMAHHQGMIFLSCANVIFDHFLQGLFEEYPYFKSNLLLLQEKIPDYISPIKMQYGKQKRTAEVTQEKPEFRIFTTAQTPNPEVHLLSNGNYHVMINNAGSGFSQFKDIALTKWREDICQDNFGFYCYIKDLETSEVGSIGFQPLMKASKQYNVVFSSSRAEFFNNVGDLSIQTNISVSPEDNIEIRRLRISNNSNIKRKFKMCTYIEPVLSSMRNELSHPVFNKMFLETEIIEDIHTLICKRKTLEKNNKIPLMFHSIQTHEKIALKTSFETDRENFIGRDRNLSNPNALNDFYKPSKNNGSIDPILSISLEILLEPDEDIWVDLFMGVAFTNEDAISIINNYKNRYISDRIFDLSWNSEQLLLRKTNLSELEAVLFLNLASALVYSFRDYRADSITILENNKSQDGLWALNISGDFPLMLVFIQELSNIQIVEKTLKMYQYLHRKGLKYDVVIINRGFGGYRQILHKKIFSIIESHKDINSTQDQGKILLFRWEQLSDEHKILLQTFASIILRDQSGSFEEQVEYHKIPELYPHLLKVSLKNTYKKYKSTKTTYRELVYYNGFGGFTEDGKEYIIFIRPDTPTPKPWINILANPFFGTIISESGGSYTWNENAHEYRITPWFNDSISDFRGEVFYLRDDETNISYSLTSLPKRGKNPYVCRHGLGYSVFEYKQDGIDVELWIFVSLESNIKFSLIKLKNVSSKKRKISLFGYTEWVLGEHRGDSNRFITTKIDKQTGALFARNSYNKEFGHKVPFFATSTKKRTYSGDRIEFIGRNRTLSNPAALERTRLSNRVGAKLDPCGAIHTTIELFPNQEYEISFILGVGNDENDARSLVYQYSNLETVRNSLQNIWNHWNHTLGVIRLSSPNKSLNFLTNYWLLYQVINSRLWARTSFYQSGGAFGFRDQLQDVMAVLHTEPSIIRTTILQFASRQFKEGDVQHWWHPPTGKGIRTHFSDDFLWLPFVTSYYCRHTKDYGVLDEEVQFLTGRPVPDGDESYFSLPDVVTDTESLYDHCKKAIIHGIKYGKHGIPLMGCGDWNDGMNLVGKDGGESVWLGMFLRKILLEFEIIAKIKNDTEFSKLCVEEANKLDANIVNSSWDGEWYLRAFFGDGTPLGSKSSEECMIDSLPQSWAILSDTGSEERRKKAIKSAYKHLVMQKEGIIKLFTPPFQKTDLNPGYIKIYPPGIRENGGQYTHAAIWLTMAFAKIKDDQKASELLNYLNPINHADTYEKISKYKTEPYIISADIYTNPEYVGQGGWTWYTGSAGWMYRLIIEQILGLDKEADILKFSPCFPRDWKEFSIQYRYYDTFYDIDIIKDGNENKIIELILDGNKQEKHQIQMLNDRKKHHVLLKIK